ncbi:hypothetical protein C8Q76DRAFT_855651 [Earliella scabrosa]|nr:hypothetical protein C8Q76DRAFT_855651 [Earliella scabrosa]
MSNSRHIGTLIVVILKARNLPNKRHIGKQDPYCQVIFNGEKRRTKAIKRGGQHPEWDEEFRFELYEDVDELPHVPGADTPPPPPPKSNGKGPPKVKGGNFLAISCYADDPREPDLIGESKVDLTEVLTKGETDEWFTIMSKDKYCGEVYLELTFWLDEPPPTKKAPKPTTNGQYGGRGTFVPIGSGDSASSSLTDLSRFSSLGSRDEIRRENLPPSLRSSNSRLDIYVAPYETTRSHNSSVDGILNDFAELRVDQGNRRQSMPSQSGSYLPRPTSAMAAPPEHATYPGHSQRQSTYSDGGGYPYDPYDYNTTRPQPYHHDSAPLPDPYQPAYEQSATPAPSNFHGHNRPRYSMPPTSSGFMPLPQPSGFVPLNSNPPQPSGFLPPPSATPAPGAYGTVVSARVPSSSFSTLPPPSIAPSGFVSQGPPPSSSYPALSQSPSHYYPPHQSQPPPTSSFPQSQPPPTSSFPQSQLTPTTSFPQGPPPPSSSFPQGPPPPSSSFHQSQPPPTSSFPQHVPPPPSSSFSSTPPTSSYTQHLPPTSSFPQQLPPPPGSAPPGSQPPYPQSPSTPLPHHSHSAPPDQSPYSNQLTSSPSHDNIPPPPPLTESPSGQQHTASRPLPQPGQSPQYPQHARRQSSLPVPPPGPPGFYNGSQNPPAFPTAYQSIPPPPPLPQQSQPQPTSSFSNGQLALPGPPPPLPTSSSLQQPNQPPPKRRPSLPPPPITHQQQQSAFQSLPPPPPPPSLPSHLQYEPQASGFAPPGQGQTYYPGPPPRPPQFHPPPHQPTQGGYSPPVSQGAEYNYGQ